MSSLEIIMETQVCPVIGAILSSLAFAAPIQTLQSAVKVGNLGDLNPTPWAFMLGNTVGWLAYAFITGDLFVFFANVFGLLISIYLNIGAMKLQYYDEVRKATRSMQLVLETAEENDARQDDDYNTNESTANETESHSTDKSNVDFQSFTPHEIKVLFVIVTWVLILSSTSLGSKNRENMERVVGISVNINLMLFYGAPLSTILTVMRSKSSSTIHFWTMVMNTSNAFFWCIYAYAIEDYYILVPNGIGFTFGVIQVLLYSMFPHEHVAACPEANEQFFSHGNEREPEIESEMI